MMIWKVWKPVADGGVVRFNVCLP